MKLNLCLGFKKSKYRIYPIKISLDSSSRPSFVQLGTENELSLRRVSLPINCHIFFFSVCLSHVVHNYKGHQFIFREFNVLNSYSD